MAESQRRVIGVLIEDQLLEVPATKVSNALDVIEGGCARTTVTPSREAPFGGRGPRPSASSC